jgi:hypothetical protein
VGALHLQVLEVGLGDVLERDVAVEVMGVHVQGHGVLLICVAGEWQVCQAAARRG